MMRQKTTILNVFNCFQNKKNECEKDQCANASLDQFRLPNRSQTGIKKKKNTLDNGKHIIELDSSVHSHFTVTLFYICLSI